MSLALFVAIMATYLQVRSHSFIALDDDLYIIENDVVKNGVTWEGIGWAFTTFTSANWHPLTWLSHMVDTEFFGVSAGPRILVNVSLHALSTVLVFVTLGAMTLRVWPSAFVAACFALHPLHVESVAWVSERKDVLSGLFWMLTLAAYAWYARRPRWTRYAWVPVALGLGLMAKPMLVTLPFVLLLLDYWPLGRIEGLGRPAHRDVIRLLVEKLPLLALSAASSITTYAAQHWGGAITPMEDVPLSIRLSNGLVAYIRYLSKTFWPSDLCVFYPFDSRLEPFTVLAAAVILIAISGGVLRERIARPYLLVGWLWYLGTLIPVIGLVKVGEQAMADRYTYIPLLGVFIMVAWMAAEAVQRLRLTPPPVVIIAGATIIVLGIACWRQVAVWRNSETLFRHALAVEPSNALIRNNLGYVLLQQGRSGEAVVHLLEGTKLTPRNVDARINLGLALASVGRFEDAATQYETALELEPASAQAHYNLGGLRAQQGRLEEAAAELQEAVRLKPTYEAHNNLGVVLQRRGDLEQAARHFARAIALSSARSEAHNNLGLVLAQQGRGPQAIAEFREAIRLDPGHEAARRNLQRAEDYFRSSTRQ